MAKKIQVQMTNKPTESGYRKELIRKTTAYPIEDVIAYAKELGIELTKKYVYTTRWSLKHPKKSKRASTKRALKKAPVVAIIKAESTSEFKKSGRQAIPPQGGTNHLVSERAMAKLILQLGTLRARELIDRTEETFHKNLGI